MTKADIGTREKPEAVALLKQALGRIAQVLPKNTITAENMIRVASLLIAKDQKLAGCEPTSVVTAVMHASILGLALGREVHLVPYGKTCEMQMDYRGFNTLAMRSGKLKYIEAVLVYEGESFKVTRGTNPGIEHEPRLDIERTWKTVVACYATAFLTDGSAKFDVMSKAEVEEVRDLYAKKDSNGNFSPAWVKSPGEQTKKTVVRRLSKLLPQSVEFALAIELDSRQETVLPAVPTQFDDEQSMDASMKTHHDATTAELKDKLADATVRAEDRKLAEA